MAVRRVIKIAFFVVCGLVLVIGGGMFAMYKASQQVPEFYREALQVEPVKQHEASDQMLQRATTLASEVKQEGKWKALFTAEQINGWLAVDLVENHPGALPRGISNPRVAIEPDRVMLACRARRGELDSVVSLTVEPYLAEPNVMALRIRKARAGLLPLPLDRVLSYISRAANRLDLRLQWRQADGDPVALVSLRQPRDRHDRFVRIEALQLGESEVYLAGSTEQRKSEHDDDQSGVNKNRQH